MTFLELPNELLTLILICLLHDDHDPETLTSLLLVNRRLLSVAQPLTARYLWLDGTFGSFGSFGSTPILPLSREADFLDFFSDDARAGAVRCLTLTGHVENTGIELLKRLRNVTHLEISGQWVEVEDDGECFRMMYSLVGSFPALQILHVIDCYQEDEDFDEFQDGLKDDPHHADLNGFYSTDPKPISTSLRHIVCDNVDPAFRQLWFLTPGIEVVEMHMCKFKPWDDGFREIGVHRMLLRDPLFCAKVKRLQVEHRLVYEVTDKEDNDLDWLLWKARDAENIRSFFKWRANLLPCLEELILEVPFYLEHLPDILAALPEICPNLRRLKFEMSSRGHADFINSERNASLFQCNGEFESLEELRLPFTGLHYDLVTAMPCLFLNSPRLIHIYFSNPQITDTQEPSQQALLACAAGYAATVHTLRLVSWDRHATVQIIKMGSDIQYRMQSFQKPWWEERRRIGECWE